MAVKSRQLANYAAMTDTQLFDELRQTVNEARKSGKYAAGSKRDLFTEVKRRWQKRGVA